jgi:hypothetical protein
MLMADARLRLGQVEAAMAAAREGLTRAECTGERVRNAELHRLTAACHRAGPGADPGAAEVALQTALRVAREQGARMWELRAACDLARLWAERGERQKAHELLAPVYGWFTEGFNTPDLKAAKVVLDELRVDIDKTARNVVATSLLEVATAALFHPDTTSGMRRNESLISSEGDTHREPKLHQKPLGEGSKGMPLADVPRENQVVPDVVD